MLRPRYIIELLGRAMAGDPPRTLLKEVFISALVPLEDLAAGLPPHGRLMGVDLGTKTIGLAMSDVERRMASPLETIRRTKFTADVDRLSTLLKRYDIRGLVVGWPLNMDGTEGPRAQSTRSFIRQAGPLLGCPISLWDERLSTAAVTRSLLTNDVSRARRAEVVDKMAAAYILDGALDRLRRILHAPTPPSD